MRMVSAPAIMVVTYLITEIFKLFFKNKEKYLPIIAGVTGGLIGLVSYIFVPGFFIETDILTAIAIGIISGLGATGSNQLLKQFMKKGD